MCNKRKNNKYNAKKSVYNKIKFDSIFEMKRYKELLLLKNAGVIRDLELQKEFVLQDKFKRREKTYRKISYFADFYYFDEKLQSFICEDTKGFETDIYKIKKKLFLKKYPDIIFLQNSKNKKDYL